MRITSLSISTALLLLQQQQVAVEAGGSLKRTKAIKHKDLLSGLEAKHWDKLKPFHDRLLEHSRLLSGEPPVTEFPEEEGDDCPAVGEGMCTLEYIPVLCGPNSCEYPNGCNAGLAGFDVDQDCTLKFPEEPAEEEEAVCPPPGEGICTADYNPVACKPDGCEYPNACNAELAGFNVEEDCGLVNPPDVDAPPEGSVDEGEEEAVCPPPALGQCTFDYNPVACKPAGCEYDNSCIAELAGFNTDEDCEPVNGSPEDGGGSSPDEPEEAVCPPVGEGICTLEYMPVACMPAGCQYDNGCNAELAGFNVEEDCDLVNPPTDVESGGDGEVPDETGEAPSNDMCASAIPMAAGDVVTGSNTFATMDDTPACNDFLGGQVNGMWYVVEGTGSGLGGEVNATFDVQGAVFTGSCGELICVDGSAGEQFPWTYGEIKGSSIEGETYYVVVAGWEGASGDFEFTVTDGDVPPNNYCEDAIPFELGESVSGTTAYSRRPDPGTVPECSIAEALVGITSPTVWYTFVGTGSIVQFSVFADYDAQISIYEGDDCTVLDCWNQNDDSPIDGPSSLIVQPLEEGQTYYIAINGFQRQYGSFTIESEEVTPAPNDNCVDAIPLEPGVMLQTDTLAASGDPDLPFCGLGSNDTSPGVWFSLVGTGNPMQIMLNDTLETHFSVYTGDCDDLVCAGNQFLGFLPFTWDTVEGEEYKVYVYGRQHALTDTFGIVAEEVERPANDDCADAVPLELNAAPITGTTRASSPAEGLEFCGDVTGIEEWFGGVWYSFEGGGDTRLVGVSSGVNNTGLFDVVISVYSGSCDDLTCLDGNDEGSTFQDYENAVILDTTEGETYYVYVYGFGVSRGDFEIALLGVPRPENDDCSTAEGLELGDSLVASTAFANKDDDWSFETCGTSQGGNSTAPGIWYSVVGGGFPVEAMVMGQYDIQLTVFSGSCDALECVDGTDGNEGDFFNGRVIWSAEDGVEYYILVHGYNGHVGEFELFYETAITRN